MSKTTVVESLAECQSAVESLEKEEVIAVDSEGVHLSKTGPLTLLQVATSAGRVFLFDVMRKPGMFQDGGLQRLLENETTLKVLHSAKNDAEALYWQYKVDLKRVHDTQVAHMEMQRAEGRNNPPRSKLADLCSVYCPAKTYLVDEDKDLVATKMNRTEGEYWAKRPLTQEMINYAASDVIALVPEMYTAQIQLLQEKDLTGAFQDRVARELQGAKDREVAEKMKKETKEVSATTLKEFAKTASRTIRIQDITDQNVLDAIDSMHLREEPEVSLPAFIRELKIQDIKIKLDEIETELEDKGSDCDVHGRSCGRLNVFKLMLEDGPVKRKAGELQNRVNVIILEDMKTKYTISTPLCHVAPYEKGIVSRCVRAESERDASVNPVVLNIYWKVKIQFVKDETEKFTKDPDNYTISEGCVKLLKYFLSGDVPNELKERARQLLASLQQHGTVTRPPTGRRGYRF